ncbi:MAG: DUF2894 domain-containing protein [Halioglobus sp.]
MSDASAAELKLELDHALSAVRETGAEHFDPTRFQIITSMADKALHQRPQTAQLVRKRALARLSAYQLKLQCEQERAEPLAAEIGQLYPEQSELASQLLASYQFAELRQLSRNLRRHATARQMEQLSDQLTSSQVMATPEHTARQKPRDFLRQQEFELTQPAPSSDSSAEFPRLMQQMQLRSAQQCREALAQLEAEHLVLQASRAAPEDSGPLNPKKLAIRSLLTLQALSPDYAGRLVSYLDTLAWLEQID